MASSGASRASNFAFSAVSLTLFVLYTGPSLAGLSVAGNLGGSETVFLKEPR